MLENDAPILDLEEALKKLGGRQALLAKLQKSFRRDAPKDISRLRTAVSTADWDEVKLVSHKLKGEALTVGASRVGEAARIFHEAAKRGESGLLPGMLPELESEIETALARFE